ncbi:MAG: MerR family transcriptional regulator [Prolixibacteraceae bacterium]|nr:MerR family transcriptional regulator [Prolixibacteraceae bacterium]
MGFKAPKSEKLYFSIGEVAEKFNLAPSALRFWEKEFDTIKPFKNKKGNRFYTQEDIDHLAIINHLVKERGLTLKGAKAKIKDNKEEVDHNFEIVQKLQEIKKYLIEIKETL